MGWPTIDIRDGVVEEVGHEDPVDDGGTGDSQQREEGAEVLPGLAHQSAAHLGELRDVDALT